MCVRKCYSVKLLKSPTPYNIHITAPKIEDREKNAVMEELIKEGFKEGLIKEGLRKGENNNAAVAKNPGTFRYETEKTAVSVAVT